MKPILFLSDSPDLRSGLGRIGRDLSVQLASNPNFRVGYLGLGGHCSKKLPYSQYVIQWDTTTDEGQWGEVSLPEVWNDFSRGEQGILFTIWDPTRLFWLMKPGLLPDGNLRNFLLEGHFETWGYFPIDATGPNARLTLMAREALNGYARRLAYTQWAKGLIERGGSSADWMPHGMSLALFTPRDKKEARSRFGTRIHDADILIGVVATNQMRKDWGTVAATCAELKRVLKNRLRLWFHVDVLQRDWSIPALLADYGLEAITTVTLHRMSDEEMSYYYSACDLTLAPGLGEGFGYPIVESLACGTPVIHGDYGGGAELLQVQNCRVPPRAFRLETINNCLRPVFEPADWAQAALKILEVKSTPEFWRSTVEHLDWGKLWPTWSRWFEEGL